MPSTLSLNKFNLGLLGEKVVSSINFQGSLKQCENAICELTGSVRKRAGTRYLGTFGESALLFPFIYNNQEAFIIILSPTKVTIFNPLTNSATWSTNLTCDPKSVSIYQVQDVVYFCSEEFYPKKLIRLNKAGTNWSFGDVNFIEPPWLPENETDYTFKASVDCIEGTTAKDTSVNLTSSMPESLLASSFKVGQWIRLLTIKDTASYWAWFRITGISAQNLVCSYQGGTCYTNYTSKIWRESAFREGRYPRTCCIHESRMCYCMGKYVFLSKTGFYETFSMTNEKAVVSDDSAMTLTLSMKQASTICWCASDRNLLIGTENEEYAIKNDDYGTAITPVGVKTQQQSSIGSEFFPVITTNGGVIAIKKFGKKVQFYSYSSENYRYATQDLMLYNEEICDVGINDIAFASDPIPVLWLSLTDGSLVGCTLDLSQNVIAFHKHNTKGEILSITTIPNAVDGKTDLYMLVRRNGKNFIEVLDNGIDVSTKNTKEVYYSDSSYKLVSDTAKTHWTGLTHLANQTIVILADGAVQPEVQVNNEGEFDIQYPAKTVIAGLEYDMYVQPSELSVQEIVLENKNKCVLEVNARLYKTVGCWIGAENDKLMEIPWRNTNNRMNVALPLYTDMKKLLITGGWRRDGAIVFGHKTPLPFNLLAIYFTVNIGK